MSSEAASRNYSHAVVFADNIDELRALTQKTASIYFWVVFWVLVRGLSDSSSYRWCWLGWRFRCNSVWILVKPQAAG